MEIMGASPDLRYRLAFSDVAPHLGRCTRWRVERANSNFQDRLVAEPRPAGANTLAEANQVLAALLPRFNQCFGVPAEQLESAFRPLDPELDLAGVLCIKVKR